MISHWRAEPIHTALCVVAIVVGVLMAFNAIHFGVGTKAVGVAEATLGVLALF